MLASMWMPRCTESMPSRIAAGCRIGAKIRMIDDGSITLPASSRITLTSSRKPTTPRSLPMIQSAIACGMFSCDIRNENSTALVMMYSSIALRFADDSSTRGTSLKPMSL